MKGKKFLWLFIAILMIFHSINSFNVPYARANGQIPQDYHQNLNLNGTYVYNVTETSIDPTWWYVFSDEGFFETRVGGQIIVNFTGFYPRDPFDWGDVMPDDMPYMNISIYNNTPSGLNLNFTQTNVSNKEAAFALTLGYNSFQSGFLIPTNNLTNIKQLAIQEASGGVPGDVIVEITNNFFYVNFTSDNKAQNVTLIYDKTTGVLFRANISAGGYKLEIFLTNFSLDYNQTFIYDVEEFSGVSMWWWGVVKGFWETSPNGQIHINFTGFFPRDPVDWGDIFPNNISYMNISIYNFTGLSLLLNFSQVNISNKEIANGMTLGYNGFQSGFLLQLMDNLTLVKQLALQEAGGAVPGIVNLYESGTSIKITYEADDQSQQTYLIYEKWTGILLWANSSVGGYHILFKMQNYTLWSYEEIPPTEAPEELDDLIDRPSGFDDLLYLVGLINIISMGAIGFSIVKAKSRKFQTKHGLIATLGVALFASLIFFSYGIFPYMPREIPEPPNEDVHNITLIIDYSDGRIDRWDNFNLTEGNTTILDALNKYVDYEYEDHGVLGYLVVEIDGYRGNGWVYGVNGVQIGYSFHKYNLEDNDVINWVYGPVYHPP